MNPARFTLRKFFLLLADVAILYSGVFLAMYVRLGLENTLNELNVKNGWLKITLASGVCLLVLYFYDLYDYVVMTNRRELMLRLATERAAAAGISLRIPPLSLCTDNGAMIAALGARLIAHGHAPSQDFGADSTLPVTVVQT